MKSRSPAWLQGVLHALCVGISTGLLFISTQASSQDETDNETVELDRVSVTGTRIKRVDIEGSTPITTITREEIDAAGDATISELLRQMDESGTTVP
jgi:iron complex outermembrane receptor protein